jgi:hypothetical protein
MSIDALIPTGKTPVHRPVRVRRALNANASGEVVDVGPGTKWANPIKRRDVETLVSSEPDISAAWRKGGWKLAALVLYRDYLLEKGLDPTELQGKDLSCTCKLTDPCHADVLIELANA